MEELFSREKYDLLVDATHPYAQIVTENLVQACKNTETPYLRLLRESAQIGEQGIFVQSTEEAAAFLNTTEGNILLTTGSKELGKFQHITGFADRVYARVLPMENSLELCRQAGLAPAHILAMQGPFSQEMNVAMLRMVQAQYLVTKESGTRGGFQEKAEAARRAGAKLLVIGRPPQQEGLSYEQVVKHLQERFSLTCRPLVTVVGIGPGAPEQMTLAVKNALHQADCLIGAERMLKASQMPGTAQISAIAPEKIREAIENHPQYRKFAVIMSGDVGFFSGTKKLLPMLSDCQVQVEPGISSLSYLCAKLGISYEDAVPVSLHGREHDLLQDLKRYRKVFTLVGGENGMGKLCRELRDRGMGQVLVSAGQRLSYPDEKIFTGTVQELAEVPFDSLCVAIFRNPNGGESMAPGLPDELFQRGQGQDGVVPMTKSEVRAVCLSKLRLKRDSICWDVGAGTGSVSIEMALQAPEGQVYAIEKKEAALELLSRNCEKFGTGQVQIISGTAPDACRDLPAPTHVFVGGSSGNMEEILTLAREKNPQVRIVATAIALETVGELTALMKKLGGEAVSLTVARDRTAGAYHLMTGQNPVYIFTFGGENV